MAGVLPDRRPSFALVLLAAASVVLLAGLVYRATLLPGMDLGDTPSFQIMGGSSLVTPRDAYPLYFALAAPFVWWNGADPAHALNLASAAEAAAACGVLVLVGVALSGSLGAATAAGILFAASYTFWSQAILAEVYALHILCVGLVLLAAIRWQRCPTTGRLALLFLLYAAGFGNHLTMILLLPGLLVFLGLAGPARWRTIVAPRTVALGVLCAACGALLYAWNIRTLLADPTPPRSVIEAARWFWFDVTKSDWRDTMVMTFPMDMAGERLRMLLFEVHQQFGWPMLAVSSIGLGTLLVTETACAALLLTWLVANTAFALTYNVGDPHVFLLPTHFTIAALLAPGIARVASLAGRAVGRRARLVVTAAFLAAAGVRLFDEYPALDRSQDRRARAALDRLTGDLDDRRELLLSDLHWELQNGLNYYGRVIRRDLSFVHTPQVLPYAPRLIRDNQAVGRTVVLDGRSREELEEAYGPFIRTRPDPRLVVPSLGDRVGEVAPGTRYVLCYIKPTSEVRDWDPANLDRVVAQLTGGRLTGTPVGDYVAIAGLAGQPPSFVEHGNRPFRVRADLDGVPVRIRMESWLPFDTIRRMGFGQVIARRHHALIVERGVSFVTLDGDGHPGRTEYAAGLYAPEPRFLVDPIRE